MVNNTEFCFTSLKTHWRSLTGKGVPLDAVWALGSRGGVVDSVFGAGLHPRSCILCLGGGDVWVHLRAGLHPRSPSCAWGETFGLLSVFAFFS